MSSRDRGDHRRPRFHHDAEDTDPLRRGGRRVEGGDGRSRDMENLASEMAPRHGHHHNDNTASASNNRDRTDDRNTFDKGARHTSGGGSRTSYVSANPKPGSVGGGVRRTFGGDAPSQRQGDRDQYHRTGQAGSPRGGEGSARGRGGGRDGNVRRDDGGYEEEEEHRTVSRYRTAGNEDLRDPTVSRALGRLRVDAGKQSHSASGGNTREGGSWRNVHGTSEPVGSVFQRYQRERDAASGTGGGGSVLERQSLLLLANVDECVQDVHLWHIFSSFGVIPVRTSRGFEANAVVRDVKKGVSSSEEGSCLEREVESRNMMRNLLVADFEANREEERRRDDAIRMAQRVASVISAEVAQSKTLVDGTSGGVKSVMASPTDDKFFEDTSKANVTSSAISATAEEEGARDDSESVAAATVASSPDRDLQEEDDALMQDGDPQICEDGDAETEGNKSSGSAAAGESAAAAECNSATHPAACPPGPTLTDEERSLARRHESAIAAKWGLPLPDPKVFIGGATSSSSVLEATISAVKGVMGRGASSSATPTVFPSANPGPPLPLHHQNQPSAADLVRSAQAALDVDRMVVVQLRRPLDLVEAVKHLDGAIINGRRVRASLLGY